MLKSFIALLLLLGQIGGTLWFAVSDGLAAALVFFVAWAALAGLLAQLHGFFSRLFAPRIQAGIDRLV